MDNIIAIYGKTCSLKTEVAQEISRLTGFKLTNRGELATTHARVAKAPTAASLPEAVHRKIDEETIAMTGRDEPLMIFESTFMDLVLKDVPNVFFVHLAASDEVRNQRWTRRKEDGGGRTRQLGESVAARDQEDELLRARLYGATANGVKPVMDVDTSKRDAAEVALEIWERFQAGANLSVVTNKPPMDKSSARGIHPGATMGKVKSYDASRAPFGGYITDNGSGQAIYVHKSVLSEGGLKELLEGQAVTFDIVEDGFGGFKAVKIRAA